VAVTLAGILTGEMPRKKRASCSAQPSLFGMTVCSMLVLTPFFDPYP
jgi:hypothetical protein